MRVTKFGHACVRIEHDGTTIVVDPGMFTEPTAVDGADAVLITHEHADHYSADVLRATDAPVFTIGAVAAQVAEDAPDVRERVTVVRPGEAWEAAGIPVQAVGELHAVIHPELPRYSNCGYLMTIGESQVFHPGDALTGPGVDVDLLLAPVCAPWMKVAEGIDFARTVGAPRNLAIHDRVYADMGLASADAHFSRLLAATEQEYVRLADGTDL